MASSSSKSPKFHQLNCPSSAATDWSLLPDVLLVDILARLHTLQDLFAVRAVCQNWRNAASPSSETLSSQSPLLLVSRFPNRSESLYDVVARRFYFPPLPWTPPFRRTIAYSHSHFITVSDTRRLVKTKLLLWDLFTTAKIRLPKNPEEFTRVLLSARPDSADCVVVLFKNNSNVVQYLSVGDRLWTVEYLPDNFVDMMFLHGQLFALTKDMDVFAVELLGDSSRVEKLGGGGVVGHGFYSNVWLGELDGMMLAVRKLERDEFDVFGWNLEEKVWEEIRDLGDKALCVGVGRNAVSISAAELGLRSNCVYWTCYFKDRWVEFSLKDRCSVLVRIVSSALSTTRFDAISWVFPSDF